MALLTKANTKITLEGSRLQPGDVLDMSRPACIRHQLYVGGKGKPDKCANDYLCKQLFSPEVRFSSAPIYVKFFGLNCAWIPCSR